MSLQEWTTTTITEFQELFFNPTISLSPKHPRTTTMSKKRTEISQKCQIPKVVKS